MPTKRRRLDRKRIAGVDDADVDYLLHGTGTPQCYFDEGAARALWERLREDLLAAWIRNRPGTRPWAWWRFDAPRWAEVWAGNQRIPCLDGKLPEPRRRIGGTGQPACEVVNLGPSLAFGLPTTWCDSPLALGLGIAPDPDDPPVFESEATYLKRHGMLTERCTKAALQPERVAREYQ